LDELKNELRQESDKRYEMLLEDIGAKLNQLNASKTETDPQPASTKPKAKKTKPKKKKFNKDNYCFVCGLRGHNDPDCKGRPDMICILCDQPGHVASSRKFHGQPKNLEQRNSIQPSSIRLCAYGNQHVQNFGQISLNLAFENGVELKNQDLLVVDHGIMPVLGTNVLFPEHGESLFSIDRERLKATLHGQEVDLATEVEVDSSSKQIHSIGIEDSLSGGECFCSSLLG
jgi:hypothetical protein